MVKEIRLYIEGGGDSKATRSILTQGFSAFLKEIVSLTRTKQIRWFIVACGSRMSAFEDFQTALQNHPDAFNVMLVDSEGPVKSEPRKHLKERDGWDLGKVDEAQCHLMVQVMESWFIADITALQKYFGKGFHSKSRSKSKDAEQINKNKNVEQVGKKEVEALLKAAARKTNKRREYDKIRDGSKLLKLISPVKVRNAAAHCDRLFLTLEQKIDEQ